LLVAAGEGAILAGQAEPHRECSMAVSGDRVAWCREQGFRPSGGDFQGIGVYRSDGCFGERRGTAPPRSGHRLDEPRQVIPRQWLHPCSACFRFAWRDHCNSGSGNGQPKSDLCDRVVDFVLTGRSAAPRRGLRFPSRAELLGAMTSHGPSRESYKPSRKSRGRPTQTADVPATVPVLSSQRM